MITWKITNLDRKTSDGFVMTAHWTATAVDGEHTASVYATVSWDGEPSVPYEQLTEETVLGWVWQSVDKEAAEASLAAQIAEQKNPSKASGTPW